MPFAQAAERSAALLANAGSIRNSIQKWYLVAIGLVGGLLGMYIGARRLSAATASALLPLMPILSLAMLVLLIINAVIASLIYLSARRATGESLERIFADFEISALPPDRVGMAAHDRLRERLVSQPMSRSTGPSQAPH